MICDICGTVRAASILRTVEVSTLDHPIHYCGDRSNCIYRTEQFVAKSLPAYDYLISEEP